MFGCAVQQGTTGQNIARFSALRAGLPMSVSGMTIDRPRSAFGSRRLPAIIVDGANVTIGSGIESVSLVMNERVNDRVGALAASTYPRWHLDDRNGRDRRRTLGVNRGPDEFALQSPTYGPARQKTADAEMAPITTRMRLQDKATGAVTEHEVTLASTKATGADHARRPAQAQASVQGRPLRERRPLRDRGQRLPALGWRRSNGARAARTLSDAGSNRRCVPRTGGRRLPA